MKSKLYLLAICVLILPFLVMASCSKSATTTSSNSTQTLPSTNSTTSISTNSTTIGATATIALGISSIGGPTGLGYDSNSGEIFVTNGGAVSGSNFPSSWIISDAMNTVVQAM